MAGKNEDDNPYSFDNSNGSHSVEGRNDEDNVTDSLELDLGNRNHRNLDQTFDADQSYEVPSRKEENPFSFKRFLNQDASNQKNQGARRKVYSPLNLPSPSESAASKHNFNSNSSDLSSRLVNTPEMSSVLPDFVQDHLVVEQCYLSGSSSAIDIDNINLQNLPDLNLEHRELDFTLSMDRERSDVGHNSKSVLQNLPDFTLNAGHFNSSSVESASQNVCSNKSLPDFALSASDRISRALETNSDELPDFTVNHRDNSVSKKLNQRNETIDSSQFNRHRVHISTSPSVPLDLPSYDENNMGSLDVPLPFDLPIPAEDRTNNGRGMPSGETVSKSLPDFLSDGPIRKERLDDNTGRVSLVSAMQNEACNGLPPPEVTSPRSEQEKLQRDIESLRRQLAEKNRRIEILESELQHLHSRDQREATSLEYALQQVENNLKQTTKRATTAETALLKLKQENKILKSELCSMRAENSELRLGSCSSSMTTSQEIKNQRIAKDLRAAANAAENRLRSLLTGIENLRVIAATVENMHKFQDRTEDFQDFRYEDSASGPAL